MKEYTREQLIPHYDLFNEFVEVTLSTRNVSPFVNSLTILKEVSARGADLLKRPVGFIRAGMKMVLADRQAKLGGLRIQ